MIKEIIKTNTNIDIKQIEVVTDNDDFLWGTWGTGGTLGMGGGGRSEKIGGEKGKR